MVTNHYLEKYTGKGNLHTNNKRGRRTFGAWLVIAVNDGHMELAEVESDGSQGWNCTAKIPDGLEVSKGQIALVGTDGFNNLGFLMINGVVVKNFDDAAYDQEHRQFVADMRRKDLERLENNRDLWAVRETYLSEPLRERMDYFRKHGEDFELNGWGYELTIAELADYLVASGLEETDEIKASEAYSQCSGNQFDMAKALARMVLNGESLAGTVGGLSPITGKAFY